MSSQPHYENYKLSSNNKLNKKYTNVSCVLYWLYSIKNIVVTYQFYQLVFLIIQIPGNYYEKNIIYHFLKSKYVCYFSN